MCTNGHLLISLHTFHLYGNEMIRSQALFACLCCPARTMKENKNCLCAGNFCRGRSRGIISGKRKGGMIKEMSSVTGSLKSHTGEQNNFIYLFFLRDRV